MTLKSKIFPICGHTRANFKPFRNHQAYDEGLIKNNEKMSKKESPKNLDHFTIQFSILKLQKITEARDTLENQSENQALME